MALAMESCAEFVMVPMTKPFASLRRSRMLARVGLSVRPLTRSALKVDGTEMTR